MSKNFDSRPNRQAGPLLATALVVLLGGIGLAAVAASGGANGLVMGLIFGGALTAVLILGLLFRGVPASTLDSAFGWMRSREARPPEYVPHAAPVRRHYGENAPPTAADIRDLKGSPSNWVPSNVARRRSRPSTNRDEG